MLRAPERETLRRALLVRNVHLGKAPGSGCVDRCDNSINVPVHGGPLWIAKYHDGNSTAFKVLLVLNIFVRR